MAEVEMASKSNSDLTTFFKHVPESETDKFQTTVGEPSIEAILPPGLPGYGVDGGSVSSADETKEIKSTTTIITPDHASALSSDYSLEDEDGSIDTAQEEEKEAIALSAFEPLSSSLTAAEPLERTKSSSKNSIFPSTSTGSMLERVPSRKEGKEGKGAFLLHRIGVRKNSFTESTSPASTAAAAAALSPMDGGSSDTSSIRSQSTQHSTGSGSGLPQHRLSKRSTKLLGKFVPKFLQTSLSPSLSTPGNNTSPHLQTVGLSTRSSRSGSMSGQSHSATNKTFSADGTSTRSSAPSSNKSSRESLVLDTTHDMNSLSPGHTHMDATSPQYLEFLRSDTHISPSLMARRSSCSSVTSKMSGNSFGSKPSASSVSSFDPSESNEFRRHSGSTKGDDIMCAFEVEYDEDNVEEDQEVEEIAAAAAAAAMNADQTVNDDEDPPLSPYIIDEDCDDDFFLNSVLRKKSNPSMTTDYNEQQCGFTPVMMSSYSSGTTMSSIHSSATTPSLSGRSSTSSQASTPSPTSPLLLNGQVYPFPIIALPPAASSAMGMKSPSNTTMHHHYRSNPLPPPIKLGLDEKRSRLRDAVGEWRRSANISN
ncbi:hypothetical protein BGZ47_009967 [Haplosporangium gracile]|nr:hypothetical protein BGZ47_009967 [Haplosporangium gracile]